MRKTLLCIALAFSLSACTPKLVKPCICEPIIITENIAAPAVVSKPILPVDSLKAGDDDETVAKAYDSSIRLLRIYAAQLLAALQPYYDASSKPSTTTTTTTSTKEVPVK